MEENIKYKQNFEIELTSEVNEKIKWLTNNYEKEIGAWLGGTIKNDKILIDDLLFPEQEVSHAIIDTDGKQLVKLRKEYGDRCKRIVGHWHCITGDIPILLSDGSTITAEELYKSKKNHKLVAYNYDDNFDFILPKSIKKEYSPKILKFNVGSKTIKVTPKHLFMNPKGEWKEAKDFKEGDKMMMLKHFTQETYQKMNKDLAYFYGSLLSEGCISVKRTNKNGSKYLRGNISNNELGFLERNKKIIKRLFNYEATITKRREKKDIKDYVSPQLIIGIDRICRECVKDGFIIGRGVKRIPKVIMRADIKAKKSFLKAFVEGDGYIEKRGKNNIYHRISTVYKELASDLCYLLSSLGYKPLMRKMKQNFKKKNYDYLYEVYYQSVKQIPIKRKYDRKNRNTFPLAIKSIEKCEGEDVYSIEIPELHNYVCGFGGFISHNSHNSMKAYWSTTDDEFIDKYMEDRDLKIFLVSSVDDGIKTRLEMRKPISLMLDNLKIVVSQKNSKIAKEMEKVIKDKIIERSFVSEPSGYDGWWKKDGSFSESLGEVSFSLNKNEWEVKLIGTNKDFFDRIDNLFDYQKSFSIKGKKIDVRWHVGNKKGARRLKKKIGDLIDLELEGYFKEETKDEGGLSVLENEL